MFLSEKKQTWCEQTFRITQICMCSLQSACCVIVEHTPKLDAANLSLAETLVDAVVWAQQALMLASRVLITAGTPGHIYLDERHAKCLYAQREGRCRGYKCFNSNTSTIHPICAKKDNHSIQNLARQHLLSKACSN